MKRKGFTLIELLVVVAIIALLISILLPQLSRAKEQARIGKCLANQRNIAQSAVSYIMEEDDIVFAFPFDYQIGDYDPDFLYATEFIWGGGVSDKKAGEWDTTMGLNPIYTRTDVNTITPIDRPMNKHIDATVSWSDPVRLKGNPERYRIPMDLPDYFICPSDSSAAVPEAGSSNPPYDADTPFRTWEWWGTSYPINWYWAYYYVSPSGRVVGTTSRPGALDGQPHKRILRDKQNKGAAEWILFYENQMNFAMENAWPREYSSGKPPRFVKGWHKQENEHAAAFLDGHAVYRYFDTQHIDGQGWTTWPSRPWKTTWEPWDNYQDN